MTRQNDIGQCICRAFRPDGQKGEGVAGSGAARGAGGRRGSAPSPRATLPRQSLAYARAGAVFRALSGQDEMKHTADTLRNVILSCHSIRDARNLSHVCSECCFERSTESQGPLRPQGREARCTHVCHMRVYSKHKGAQTHDNHEGPQSHHTSSAADT